MASFTCKCGLVNVALCGEKSRTRMNCCCCDCYQKLEWAASNGGPTLPEHYQNKKSPVVGEHWNGRVVVTGKDHLAFNKLHEKAVSVNCVAQCCSTILFVDHPAYQGNCIFLFPEMIKMENSIHADKAIVITWINDWSEENKQNLDSSLPGCYVDESGQFTGTGNFGEAIQKVMGMWDQPPDALEGGQSFAELLRECGGDIVNLSLEERKRH